VRQASGFKPPTLIGFLQPSFSASVHSTTLYHVSIDFIRSETAKTKMSNEHGNISLTGAVSFAVQRETSAEIATERG
jgi:hypothetical protein